MNDEAGERRAAPRSRALIAATAIYNHGRYTAPCMVRNVSPRGALLRIAAAVLLPADFQLVYAGRAEEHRAELRWRRGDAAGIVFVTAAAAEAADAAFELALQVEALRTENAALRQQHARLTSRLAALGYVAANEF